MNSEYIKIVRMKLVYIKRVYMKIVNMMIVYMQVVHMKIVYMKSVYMKVVYMEIFYMKGVYMKIVYMKRLLAFSLGSPMASRPSTPEASSILWIDCKKNVSVSWVKYPEVKYQTRNDICDRPFTAWLMGDRHTHRHIDRRTSRQSYNFAKQFN